MEGERPLSTAFPWDLLLALARDLPRRRRSLRADCAEMVSRLQPPPLITGTHHVPRTGPLVVAANHYQRRGLWIGWAAAAVTLTLARSREQEVPVHWLVTGGIRLLQSRGAGPEIPLSGSIFRAVARTYGMTSLPLGDTTSRAMAVRRWLRELESGEVLGLFPEGLAGRSDGLSRPEPGFAHLNRLLARLSVPILPVAVFENDGRMCARFGPAFPAASADETMQSIAALLPPDLQGSYRDEFRGALG